MQFVGSFIIRYDSFEKVQSYILKKASSLHYIDDVFKLFSCRGSRHCLMPIRRLVKINGAQRGGCQSEADAGSVTISRTGVYYYSVNIYI